MISNHFGFNKQAVAGSTSPANTGLLVNLDAGNLLSYPGSGSIWTNLVGGGNNLTISNPVQWSSGSNGGSYFSSNNDSTGTGTATNLPLNATYTVSVWCRLPSFSGANFGIAGWNSSYNVLTDQVGGVTNIVEVRGSTGQDRPPASPMTTNTWFNATFTNDKTSNKKFAYKNGVQVGTEVTTGTGTVTAGNLYAMRDVDGHSFIGNLAIIKIWNTALSAADVTAEYNTYKSRYGLT